MGDDDPVPGAGVEPIDRHDQTGRLPADAFGADQQQLATAETGGAPRRPEPPHHPAEEHDPPGLARLAAAGLAVGSCGLGGRLFGLGRAGLAAALEAAAALRALRRSPAISMSTSRPFENVPSLAT